jgi:hypothetical protein
MKRLTDAYIAKLAGWTQKPKGYWRKPGWSEKHDGLCGAVQLPAFTTSLDAIVGLIEGEGLWHKSGSGYVIGGGKDERYFAEIHGSQHFYASTQALALCAAYAAYKENANA